MVTKDYGFDESIITETTIIDKDKHGFIRKTVKDADIQGDDVVFFDYDGAILHSYKADAFLKMPSMPKNPEHDGLISRGWNWSYEDAQAYVQKYGKLNVGQMYAPADGKTHIKIHIPEDGRPNFKLCFTQTIADGVIVDWGDGSEVDTSDVVDGPVHMEHTYAVADKDYEITLKTIDGCEIGYGFNDDDQNVHLSMFDENGSLRAIFALYVMELVISDSITSIEQYAFYRCHKLQSVIIPDSVTMIGKNTFYLPYSLTALVIPNSVTIIEDNAFVNCSSLLSLAVPNSVTSIGNSAFSGCYSLKSLAIPDSVTSIEINTFTGCYAIRTLVIPDSITSIEEGTFSSCYALQSLVIPNSVTSIGRYLFYDCYTLQSLVISNSATNLGESDFASCLILRSLVIPDSISDIGSKAFRNCASLYKCIIENTTPPTLGTNAFQNIPSDAKFLVPAESVDTYKAAEGWSTYASQIFAMEEE